MKDSEIISLFDKYVMPTYGRQPLVFVRGKGARVWDADGKEYLDFGGGIAVNVLGHSAMTEVLAKQSSILVHCSNLYYTEPQGLLAKRLVELVGIEGKCFFCNSGGEANEALYKLARKFGNSGGATVGPAPYQRRRGRRAAPTRRRALRDSDVHGQFSRADVGGHQRDGTGEGEEGLRADGGWVPSRAVQRSGRRREGSRTEDGGHSAGTDPGRERDSACEARVSARAASAVR